MKKQRFLHNDKMRDYENFSSNTNELNEIA